jgi:hypothetical protein
MANKSASFSTTPYASWRLASIIVVGILTIATLESVYFMYKNIYSTISNSTAIVLLGDAAGSQTIDIATFTRTEAILKNKIEPEIWPERLRNIFAYDETTSTYVKKPTP